MVIKKIILTAFSFMVFCLISCEMKEEQTMSDNQYAEHLMYEIIDALNAKESDALEKLFSKNVQTTISSFEQSEKELLHFLNGEIVTSNYDDCIATDSSIKYGEKVNMIRFAFDVSTTNDESFKFFVICYNIDTVNPDNEGVYMIEIAKSDYDEYIGWQERMRPGISILTN